MRQSLVATSRVSGRLGFARAGFTLVELLVVIGIIALLISMLLPALGKVRGQARGVQCQANLRTIGQSMYLYADRNKGALPYGFWDGTLPAGSSDTRPPADRAGSWPMLLMNALDPRLGTNWNTAFNTGANTTKLRQALFCPELGSVATDQLVSASTHYLSHPRIMPQMGSYPGDVFQTGTPSLIPYKLAKIKRATEIIVIFDGSMVPTASASGEIFIPRYQVPVANALDNDRINNAGADSTALTDNYSKVTAAYMTPNNAVDITAQGYLLASTNKDIASNPSNIRFRHSGNKVTNALFADGHVGSFLLKSNTQSELQRKNINVNYNR